MSVQVGLSLPSAGRAVGAATDPSAGIHVLQDAESWLGSLAIHDTATSCRLMSRTVGNSDSRNQGLPIPGSSPEWKL